ncbi:hypothetical protein AB5J62_15110 [Amycolatopsis sp. cg5]|uniref:hypothetical protein n=1 Tax=Amycolatopsis sp. cg5 TaxID=3238802 RepID=UPI0035254671
MSMLAYVATIESIGKRNVPLRKCKNSDGCTAMVGYGDRVVKSLQRVLHKAEIRNLYNIDDLRSRVAHDGSLVGYDRLLGVSTMASLFAADPSHDLELNLWVLMKACRRLLTLELNGPETWPQQRQTPRWASWRRRSAPVHWSPAQKSQRKTDRATTQNGRVGAVLPSLDHFEQRGNRSTLFEMASLAEARERARRSGRRLLQRTLIRPEPPDQRAG